jgi:hypothetical protein
MDEMLIPIISTFLGAGGGLTAVISILLTRSKERRDEKRNEIDDRISEWKRIAEKHEKDMEELKRRYDIAQIDNHSLELYIRELIIIVAKANPSLDIPPYPNLITVPSS